MIPALWPSTYRLLGIRPGLAQQKSCLPNLQAKTINWIFWFDSLPIWGAFMATSEATNVYTQQTVQEMYWDKMINGHLFHRAAWPVDPLLQWGHSFRCFWSCKSNVTLHLQVHGDTIEGSVIGVSWLLYPLRRGWGELFLLVGSNETDNLNSCLLTDLVLII